MKRIRMQRPRSVYALNSFISKNVLGYGDAFLWDCEFDGTPIDEQRDIFDGDYTTLQYLRRNCARVGIQAWGHIATTLLTSFEDEWGGSQLEEYLRRRIPANAARYLDGFNINGQQGQQNTLAYQDRISRVATQLRSSNPYMTITSGITTASPRLEPDDYPTAWQIASAMKATDGIVEGWWLNVTDHRTTGESLLPVMINALKNFHGVA
jgi:hypothetical protein